ncbi:DUF7537 family lipoprotein [Halomarina litorea]|uniref:DUF7537 family lipoprotein n=1 Tax=Halomarina litorea TaxID=2961595 RepID=UPI0020C1E7D6|nr:hypothetical protein [Halomarina sp. BCD28]
MAHTRILSVVLLAVLVTTAGCSGLLGDASTPGETPAVDRTTDTNATDATATNDSTATATPAETDLSSLAPDAVRARHTEGLREAGSFNATRSITIASNDSTNPFSTFSLTSEFSVDFESNRSIERSSFFGTTVTYTAANGTTYRQQMLSEDASPEDASYSVSDPDDDSLFGLDPVNVTEAIGTDALVVGENVSYEAVGTETVDGVTVTRYETSGVEQLSGENLLGNGTIEGEDTRVENFTATLLVDGEGIVRLTDWHIEFVDTANGTAYELGVRHEISAVGEVVVEEPGWLQYVDDSGPGYETPTNCSAPSAEGTIGQTPAGDGTYNVTFEAASVGQDTVVRLTYEGVGYENYIQRAAYFSDDVARTKGLEPGTVVEAVAENSCGGTVVLATHTVEAGADSSANASSTAY